MRILFVYGSTEGHTRDLSHFAAERLRETGHPTTVEVAGADTSHPDPGAYDVTFLAASLHVGRYQPTLVHYARAQHGVLNARPSAFISVSLAAAGVNPHDWEGLEQCLARFQQETLWTPRAVHQAAGAIRYSQYDFFKALALRFIAHQRGRQTSTSHDYDLTDYDALRRFVLAFVEENRDAAAAASPGPQSQPLKAVSGDHPP